MVGKGKCDAELGKKVVEHLRSIGMLGSEAVNQLERSEKIEKLEPLFKQVLQTLGMNLEDGNVEDTPRRMAKLYANELFYGMDYKTFPKVTTIEQKYVGYDSFVLEKDVKATSCCSHHFVPMLHNKACADGTTVIGGGCVVAYIPESNKVIGLSKINRIVEWCGKRAQTQEQYTKMVVEVLKFVLGIESVICWMNLQHMCVALRGVEDTSSNTITMYCSGQFETNRELRSEFLAIARNTN